MVPEGDEEIAVEGCFELLQGEKPGWISEKAIPTTITLTISDS
jgi:hypothetical protein